MSRRRWRSNWKRAGLRWRRADGRDLVLVVGSDSWREAGGCWLDGWGGCGVVGLGRSIWELVSGLVNLGTWICLLALSG